MIRSNRLVLLLVASIVSSSLVACNAKDEKKDEKLTYQFDVNGCDTGLKTFGDLKSYCEALIDDEKNNHCAKSLRLQEYQLKCQAVAQKKEQDPISSPETSQLPPTTLPEPSFPPKTTTPGLKEDKILPKEVVIEAHFEEMVRISPKDAGDELLSALQGKAIVDSISPKIQKPLRLDRAEKSVFSAESDLGKCELAVNQYKIESDNSAIHFHIVGIDKKDQIEKTGCVSLLSTMAMTGFVIEFQNVPMGGSLSQDVIPKVFLKVEPKD